MGYKVRKTALFAIALGLASANCGCSILMEAARDDYKDVTVLQSGATRAHVTRYVGEPSVSYPSKGGTIDVYRIDPDGQSVKSKIAMGAVLLSADALTFGVAEALFTPLEVCSWNRKVDFIVAYTSEGTIQSVHCAHPDSDVTTLMKGPSELADERQMSCPYAGARESAGAFCEQR
jgi:hypothetical protein